jgi:hypothetical protein
LAIAGRSPPRHEIFQPLPLGSSKELVRLKALHHHQCDSIGRADFGSQGIQSLTHGPANCLPLPGNGAIPRWRCTKSIRDNCNGRHQASSHNQAFLSLYQIAAEERKTYPKGVIL